MRNAWVDFNNLDGLRTTTLRKFVEGGVSIDVGASLVVGDYEGTLCNATVTGLRGEIVDLALTPGTFKTNPVLSDAGRRS
jgi:hypothetical protein